SLLQGRTHSGHDFPRERRFAVDPLLRIEAGSNDHETVDPKLGEFDKALAAMFRRAVDHKAIDEVPGYSVTDKPVFARHVGMMVHVVAVVDRLETGLVAFSHWACGRNVEHDLEATQAGCRLHGEPAHDL